METQLLYAMRNQKTSCDFLAIISLLQWSETEPIVSLRGACISVAGQVTLSYGSCADKTYQICVLILRLLILFIWWLPTWFMVPGTKLWLSIIWQTLFNLTLNILVTSIEDGIWVWKGDICYKTACLFTCLPDLDSGSPFYLCGSCQSKNKIPA